MHFFHGVIFPDLIFNNRGVDFWSCKLVCLDPLLFVLFGNVCGFFYYTPCFLPCETDGFVCVKDVRRENNWVWNGGLLGLDCLAHVDIKFKLGEVTM